MKFAHGLVLVIVALLSYFVLALRSGIYQRYPLAQILFAGAGVCLMMIKLRNSFSILKLSATLFSASLLALFVWWSLSYSTYGESAQQLVARAPGATQSFGLKTTAGEAFDFNAALKKARRTLLVFNRGAW
jgi:hypothetical protein